MRVRFFISIFIFILFLSFQGTTLHSYVYDSKKILVLNSYHKGLSWTEEIVKGIDFVFYKAAGSGLNIKIDYEYMDTKRYVSKKYYEMLYGIFKYKFSKLKYDAIICSDDNAFNFLIKYRNDIFGKIPVVFCGVNFFSPSLLKGKKNYTGVVEDFDVQSTLNVALKLHRETREFVIVGDKTTTSNNDRRAVKKVMANYVKKGIKITFLKNANIKHYKNILHNLKKGSVVILMHLTRDDKGNYYSFKQGIKIISDWVNVPVYSFWDFYLGNGIVGGMIVNGFTQGEKAAMKALQIIRGQKIRNVPILMKSPNRYMFDYNEMEKFNIELKDLPSRSFVINKPASFKEIYKEFKTVILGVFVIVLFLIAVIFILGINIIKRKKVETDLIQTNTAYDKFVPHEFLDNIDRGNIVEVQLGDQVMKDMTVLFSHIHQFTQFSSSMTSEENFTFINSYLSVIGPVIRKHSGFIDKYMGDAVMALFPHSSDKAVKASIEMQNEVFKFNEKRKMNNLEPVSIGVGIHSGSLMMGTVGEVERMDGTVISDTVNLASRLEGLTKIYGAKIIFSEDVYSYSHDESATYTIRYLGNVKVKGKNEPVKIYEVIDGHDDELKELKIKTILFFNKGRDLFFAKNLAGAKEQFENIVRINSNDLAVNRYLTRIEEIQKSGLTEWNPIDELCVK